MRPALDRLLRAHKLSKRHKSFMHSQRRKVYLLYAEIPWIAAVLQAVLDAGMRELLTVSNLKIGLGMFTCVDVTA